MDASLGVKAVRVTLHQFIDIVLCHIFEGHTKAGSGLRHIPQNISKLVQQLVRVKGMTLKLDLFQNVDTLTGFTVQAITTIANFVPRSQVAGSALCGFLIVMQRQVRLPAFPAPS